MQSKYTNYEKIKITSSSGIYKAIYIYSGINETKQRELALIVSCLHNHSANL